MINDRTAVSKVKNSQDTQLNTDYYTGPDFHPSKANPATEDPGLGWKQKAATSCIIHHYGQSDKGAAIFNESSYTYKINAPYRPGANDNHVTVYVGNTSNKPGVNDFVDGSVRYLYQINFSFGFRVFKDPTGQVKIKDLTGQSRLEDVDFLVFRDPSQFDPVAIAESKPSKLEEIPYPDYIQTVKLNTPNNGKPLFTLLPENIKFKKDRHSPIPGPIIHAEYPYFEAGTSLDIETETFEIWPGGPERTSTTYEPIHVLKNVKAYRMTLNGERLPVAWTKKYGGTVEVDFSQKDTKRIRPFYYQELDNDDGYNNGSWVIGLNGMTPNIYLIDRLKRYYESGKKSPGVIAEGEGCTEAGWYIGIPTTTAMNGASSYRSRYTPEILKQFVEYVNGEPIGIFMDNDKAGKNEGRLNYLYHTLVNLGVKPYNIVFLYASGKGNDLYDYVCAGGQAETIISTIYNTAEKQKLACEIEQYKEQLRSVFNKGLENFPVTQYCENMIKITDFTGIESMTYCPDKDCDSCSIIKSEIDKLRRGLHIPSISFIVDMQDETNVKKHNAFIKAYYRSDETINNTLVINSKVYEDPNGNAKKLVSVHPHRRLTQANKNGADIYSTVDNLYDFEMILAEYNLLHYLQDLGGTQVYSAFPEKESYLDYIWGELWESNGTKFVDLSQVMVHGHIKGYPLETLQVREPGMIRNKVKTTEGCEYLDAAWANRAQRNAQLGRGSELYKGEFPNLSNEQQMKLDQHLEAQGTTLEQQALSQVFDGKSLILTDYEDQATINELCLPVANEIISEIIPSAIFITRTRTYDDETYQQALFTFQPDNLAYLSKEQAVDDLALKISEKYGYEYNEKLVTIASYYRTTMSRENKLTNTIPNEIPRMLKFMLGGKPKPS